VGGMAHIHAGIVQDKIAHNSSTDIPA
jgi:hypothetical protein